MTARFWCILLAGLAAMDLHRQCSGQEIQAGATPPTQALYFDPPEAVLELRTIYNSSSINPTDGTSKTRTEDTLLRELLGVSTHGYVVNPDVIDFNAAGKFGLQQRWETLEGTHVRGNDSLYEYDANLTLMRNSETPLRLSANRAIDYVPQPFSETYQTTSNNYDATWELRSRELPMTFRIFHNDITLETISGVDDFTIAQEGAEWHGEVNFNPASHLTANYNFNDVTETNAVGETFAYRTNTVNLSHEYDFGAKQENSLSTSFEYLNQQGDFAQELVLLDELLNLHHSDRFETFYEYQFQLANYPEVDSTLNRLKTGFRAKPFDGLEATGNLGGLNLDLSGANTNEGFGQLWLDYTKPAPLGQFSAFVHGDADYQANGEQSTDAHVVARRTFDTSQQIVLPYVGIKQNSIMMRSASGPAVYFDGIDFTTVYHNNRAIITRIPDGNLPADSLVIIDYDVDPKPANDVTTTAANMGLRYDFKEGALKGLGLYTRYFVQRQNIASDQPGAFIEDDIDALTYGAEYRIWRLRFNAEHERHNSDLFPYHSTQFGVRYEDRLGRDLTLALAANQVQTTYDDTVTHSVASTATGEIGYRINRQLSTTFTVNYLDLDDDETGGARGLDEQLAIKFTHRDTTIKGTIRHSDLETDDQDSSFLFFMLSVERRF